jgi:hypothetical protein
MATPRVSRGRRIQALATIYFQQNGWVSAENTPASLPGKDVTGMPSWAPEVKGTRDNPLPAALRQAAKNAEPGETPLVVWCPDGYGEAKIDDWVVAFRFKDAVELMREREGFNPDEDFTFELPKQDVTILAAIPKDELTALRKRIEALEAQVPLDLTSREVAS